jgi:hypothetical protein
MKRTSITLIIVFMVALCTRQIVIYSVDDREGGTYLLVLNVCGDSHDAFSPNTETPCINEHVFEFVTHPFSRYLTPAFMRFDSLPASERDHPPRFLA